MNDKKNRILKAALELFAKEGYRAVATSKIAKKAEVSEGLIFRHFGNKQGLLDALLGQAVKRSEVLFLPIISEADPLKTIEKAIELPFSINKKEYLFWKLHFKLKWEIEYSGRDKMKPFIGKLAWAFTKLGYKEPEKEAELLNHIIESISGGILKNGLESQKSLKSFLLNKYVS